MTSSVVPLSEAQQRSLGSMLWQYRSVLERVEFLLEAQLVFASSGRDKRLASVADLLEEAVGTINELDLRRELLLHDSRVDEGQTQARTTPETSSERAVDRDEAYEEGSVPSLSELADAAEQPWSSMFLEHQRWFELCVGRIETLIEQSRQTMGTTLDLIDQLVQHESAPTLGGYDRDGRTVRASSPAVLFDSRA